MRINFQKLFLILQLWLDNSTVESIKRNTGCSERTIIKYQKLFQDICQFVMGEQEQIGGPNSIVEIDESYFFKRKYNRGKYKRTGTWIVERVEHGTSNFFFKMVECRNREQLKDIIMIFV